MQAGGSGGSDHEPRPFSNKRIVDADRICFAIHDVNGVREILLNLERQPRPDGEVKDEEAELTALKAKLAASRERQGRIRPKETVGFARALLLEAAGLLGRDRETTRAALVAMLEPMRLTRGSGRVLRRGRERKIPANQEVGREVLNKSSCGGRI